jgi:hypothetical protein
MPIPTCAKKNLSLTFAFCTVVAISDCIASPASQNNQLSSPANKDNSSNASSATVDVSDLYNRDSSHAIQQLQARGFTQTRSIPPSNGFSNSWWLNSRTNQCFQLETANGKVMTLNPRTSQDLPQFRCN